MSPIWQGLIIGLWVMALLQTVLVVVLYRQVGIVYLGQSPARTRDGLPFAAPAPNWNGVDHRGLHITSEALLGKAHVLIFAEPECGPCQRLMPELKTFESNGNGVDLVVIGSEEVVANQQMADRYLLSSPIVAQPRRDIANAFKITATPFMYVIDEEGMIREKGIVNYSRQIEEKLEVLHPNREGADHGRQARATYN